MPDFISSLLRAVRQWPLYSALAALVLALFVGTGLRGTRWLGDDNETEATELVGGPRAGGHGGYGTGARFYHK